MQESKGTEARDGRMEMLDVEERNRDVDGEPNHHDTCLFHKYWTRAESENVAGQPPVWRTRRPAPPRTGGGPSNRRAVSGEDSRSGRQPNFTKRVRTGGGETTQVRSENPKRGNIDV